LHLALLNGLDEGPVDEGLGSEVEGVEGFDDGKGYDP